MPSNTHSHSHNQSDSPVKQHAPSPAQAITAQAAPAANPSCSDSRARRTGERQPALDSTSKPWRRSGSNRRPPACKAGALPLSYAPSRDRSLVGQGGLEPPTPRLSSVCSNQLSYWPKHVAGPPDPAGQDQPSLEPISMHKPCRDTRSAPGQALAQPRHQPAYPPQGTSRTIIPGHPGTICAPNSSGPASHPTPSGIRTASQGQA